MSSLPPPPQVGRSVAVAANGNDFPRGMMTRRGGSTVQGGRGEGERGREADTSLQQSDHEREREPFLLFLPFLGVTLSEVDDDGGGSQPH